MFPSVNNELIDGLPMHLLRVKPLQLQVYSKKDKEQSEEVGRCVNLPEADSSLQKNKKQKQ